MSYESRTSSVVSFGRIQQLLFLSTVASIGAYALAELVEINRFSRIWIHGNNYWCYQGIFFALVWAAVAALLTKGSERPLAVLLVVGSLVGFGAGVVSLSLLPVVCGSGTSATGRYYGSLIGLSTLLTGSAVVLSWVTGAIVGLLIYSARRGKKFLVGLVIFAFVIRVVEIGLHYRFGEKFW
jgi:hypothetical protein